MQDVRCQDQGSIQPTTGQQIIFPSLKRVFLRHCEMQLIVVLQHELAETVYACAFVCTCERHALKAPHLHESRNLTGRAERQ